MVGADRLVLLRSVRLSELVKSGTINRNGIEISLNPRAIASLLHPSQYGRVTLSITRWRKLVLARTYDTGLQETTGITHADARSKEQVRNVQVQYK